MAHHATIMAVRKTDHALVTIKYTDNSLQWIICPTKDRLDALIRQYEPLPNVQTILIQYP